MNWISLKREWGKAFSLKRISGSSARRGHEDRNLQSKMKTMATLVMVLWLSILPLLVVISMVSFPVPVRAEDEVAEPSVSITPGYGPVGTEVLVRIKNFTPKKGVTICAGDKNVLVDKLITDSDGGGIITFIVRPRPAGFYQIWADDGVIEEWAIFTIGPRMELTDTSGYVGDALTLSGDGFLPERKVTAYFDGKAVGSGTADENGTLPDIIFNVSPSCRGKHTIRMEGGKDCNVEAIFTTRQEFSLSPQTGIVGSEVIIAGSGFKGASYVIVYFDDVDLTGIPTDEYGSFSASFNIPKAGNGIHRVKADDGDNRYYEDFTVGADLKCRPAECYIGQKITIEGTGFCAGVPVNISIDKSPIDAPIANDQGAFTFVCTVPKLRHGEHGVGANDGTNIKEVNFTVESNPPAMPELIYPPSAARLSQDARFGWNKVDDSSGVMYMLEIAAEAEFSEIIYSDTDITSNEYILTEDQQKLIAISKRPYYWRVRAIDGASNVGQWSKVSLFMWGPTFSTIIKHMPMWAAYVLVGFLLLMVCCLFFFLGRRITGRYQDEYYESDYADDSGLYSDSI